MKKQAMNPILPSFEYIPDGEPYVFGDRVYVYGSHDKFNGDAYCINNYVCWSAPVIDLGNWRSEGVIYDKTKDPMCSNFDEYQLFAPDVQQGVDGRYYLYYSFNFESIMAVAVCDTPAGEYEFLGHVHYPDGTLLGRKAGDAFQFDPGVLVDDDGRVFLYSGFCPEGFPWKMFGKEEQKIIGGMVIELEPDMVTVKEAPKFIVPYTGNSEGTGFEGHEFFEAPSMRKIGESYYFIYSSINGHELCYATSKRPDGDFVFGGTIISNGDIFLDGRTDEDALNYTGNNHGSIVEINGAWYVFYHRQTNKNQFSRQACAEKIVVKDNGRIKQVEMTSCGLNGGPLKGSGMYEARIACILMSRKGAMRYEFNCPVEAHHPYFTQEGEDRESDPNQYIANMTEGSVAGFKYFAIDDLNRISVTIRGNGEGIMEVASDIKGLVHGKIKVNAISDWQQMSECIRIPSGISALYFTYKGTGYVDFRSFKMD